MANKYVDTSLSTGLNDGSSVVNAWQSFSEVLKNTQVSGAYAAGDIIYVRTHDGVADLTEVVTTSIVGAAIGVDGNPVTFKFDNGVVWGAGGTFTLRNTTIGVGSLSLASYTDFLATKLSDTVYGFNFDNTAVAHGNSYLSLSNNRLEGVLLSKNQVLNLGQANQITVFGSVTLVDCKVSNNANWNNLASEGFKLTSSVHLHLIRSILDAENQQVGQPFQANGAWGTAITYDNCKVINANPNTHFLPDQTLENSSLAVGRIKINGGSYPNVLTDAHTNVAIGMDATLIETGGYGDFSFTKVTPMGTLKWEKGLNYPARLATLPNGDNWSIKVFPFKCSKTRPLENNSINYLHSSVAAIRTITQEIVVKDTVGNSGAFNNPKNDEWFIDVVYTDDATGTQKTVRSTTDGSALPSSSATWAPEIAGVVTYGALNYVKHKLTVTTPTTVRQNTLIKLVLSSTVPSVSVDDFYFVDPDILVV